ncbi:hypothetical protein [Dyella silvatica]|uniref:hypothetical protein n=1 Tax=Dyella silvatica TaxID=2992128 RepID=UPI003CCD6C5F
MRHEVIAPGIAKHRTLLLPGLCSARDGGGSLPGDAHSQATGINEQRQVVGLSCTAHVAGCRAFMWQENGVMSDLIALVATGFSDLPSKPPPPMGEGALHR